MDARNAVAATADSYMHGKGMVLETTAIDTSTSRWISADSDGSMKTATVQ